MIRNLVLSSLLLAGSQASNTSWPYQSFRTVDFKPPGLKITKHGPTSEGYLFFDQSWDTARQMAPFIMSDENELIWRGTLDGKSVLTFWNGTGLKDPWRFGYGEVSVLDDSYEEVYKVTLSDSSFKSIDNSSLLSWIDMHEDRITDRGTMLVTAINVTQSDLTSVGGSKDGWIADSLFYEIDVKTNEIVYRWSALEHVDAIPLEKSLLELDGWGQNQTYPWGYFHINSVDPFDDGGFLVSSQFYCSVFRLNKDGSVEWTLQGRHSGDFEIEDFNFCYQHDARLRSYTPNRMIISLYDNSNSIIEKHYSPSKGLYFDMDLQSKKVTLSRQLSDPRDEIYSISQGNNQLFPDQHVILGHGSNLKITEYNADGSRVMTVQFGRDNQVSSYRRYRIPGTGRPKTKPAVFACNKLNSTMVYMSWNGATEHQQWRVYSGDGDLQLSAEVEKSGFETVAVIHPAKHVQVEARGESVNGLSLKVPVKASC